MVNKRGGRNTITKGTCVISGGSADELAKNITGRLKGARLVGTEVRVFADGESKLRLRGRIAGDRAVVVQSLHPPVDTNLFRMLCLVSRAKEDIRDVTVVVPYMGYARQDAEFLPGEIKTIKVLGGLLKSAGATRIVVVDMHSAKGLELLGARNTTNVTCVPSLARYFGAMNLERPVAVSPDKGGAKRAGQFAAELGCDLLVLKKSRDRRTGAVRIKTKEADAVRGRDAIIVDDMISTGGSIVKAAEFLKSQGSGRIFAACAHALLVDGARTRMKRAGVARIICANTIPAKTGRRDIRAVDVSEEIARALDGAGTERRGRQR